MKAIVILVALSAACASEEPNAAQTTSPLLATFEIKHRWPSPGAIYDLNIRENGTVEYVGKECVALKGRRVVQLGQSQFAKLRAALEMGDPAQKVCCTDIADQLAIGRGGARIQLCCRDRYGRPLFALKGQVEALIGAAPWIGNVNEQPGCGASWRLAYAYQRGQATFVQGGKKQTWVLAEGSHFPLAAPTRFELTFVPPLGHERSHAELITNFTSGDVPGHAGAVARVEVTNGPAGNWTLSEYDGASCDLDTVNADERSVEAIGHCRQANNAAALTEFAIKAAK